MDPRIPDTPRRTPESPKTTSRSFLKAQLQSASETDAMQLVFNDIRTHLEQGDSLQLEDYVALFDESPDWLPDLFLKLSKSSQSGNEKPLKPNVSQAISLTHMCADPPAPPPFVGEGDIPAQMGRYRILKTLGTGGFGKVLLAHDQQLDRQVALKIPRQVRLAQMGGSEKFLEECRSVARLSHPGIVSIYDSDQLPNGEVYAVLEYLSGGTLSERVRRSPLSLSEIVDCMIHLAEASHYAHQRGVFHLDLKPSNILFDGRGHPKISDFGLAVKAEDQASSESLIVGTPSYMSPEQCRGETRLLDGRSDIWAFGVIMYWLLVGRLPFQTSDWRPLFKEILSHDPRPLRQMDDSIPKEIEEYVSKCLEKNPKDRFQTAKDLAQTLKAWTSSRQDLQNSPPTPHPTSLEESRIRTLEVTSKMEKPRSFNAKMMLPIGLLLLILGMVFSSDRFIPWRPQANLVDPTANATLPSSSNPIDHQSTGVVPVDFSSPLETLVPADLWFPLLDHNPKVLQWPLIDRNSQFKLNAKKRELWVTVEDTGLLELGRTHHSNFRIRAIIDQSSWEGGSGLFWGYQQHDENSLSEFLLLELMSVPIHSDPQLQISLQQLVCRENGEILERKTIQTQLVPPPPAREGGMLEIDIQKKRIARVHWAGTDYPKLAQENPVFPISETQHWGAFGIYGSRSHSVIRRASFKHTSEPAKHHTNAPETSQL